MIASPAGQGGKKIARVYRQPRLSITQLVPLGEVGYPGTYWRFEFGDEGDKLNQATPAASSRTGLLRAGQLSALLWVAAPVLVFFWPFLFQGRGVIPFQFEWGSVTGIPSGGDPAAIQAPLRYGVGDSSAVLVHFPNAALVSRAFHGGELPLWNPYVGCGAPALGSGHVYPFSPFLAPFYLVPTPGFYTLGLLLGCLWSALGFYMWSGRFGVRPWMRGFGAALWAFNPWSVRLLLFADLWPNWWVGWLLWAWDGAAEKERGRWWLPALMGALAAYTGHPESALIVVGTAGLYAWVSWLSLTPERRAHRFLLRFLGVCLLTELLTAVHWLPVLGSMRDSLSYKAWLPGIALKTHYGFSSLMNPISDVYLNPVTCALIGAGLWVFWRDRKLWPLASLGIVAVTLLMRPVPGEAFERLISLGGLLASWYGRGLWWFAAAGLVVVGTSKLASAEAGGRWWLGLLIAGGFLPIAGLIAADFLMGGKMFRLVWWGWLAFYGTIALLLGFSVLISKPARLCVLAVGLLAVTLDPWVFAREGLVQSAPFKLGAEGSVRPFSFFNSLDPMAGGPPAIKDLKAAMGESEGRFWAATLPLDAPVSCLAPDLANLWGVRDVRIMDVLLNGRYLVLHETLRASPPALVYTTLTFPTATPPQLAYLGVGFCGRPLDQQGDSFRWEPVTDPMPRAYLVHRVLATRDEQESAEKLKALLLTGELRRQAILEEWTGPSQVGHADERDKVAWLEDGLNKVRLQVSAREESVVVLLDTFADGWKAEVDGKAEPIYAANLAFRGVALPPGKHQVSFLYRPGSVVWGGLLTAIGFLAIGVLLVVDRRMRKRDVPAPGL